MALDDAHTLREGRVVVYKRDNSPYYQMRLKVHGVQGYLIKSTKCRSLEEALVFASETYDDMRYKAQHGLEVKPYTFGNLWQRWLTSHKDIISVHRLRYIKGTAERYFLPYFSEANTESISNALVDKYWPWRINYWNSQAGQQKIEKAQKTRTTDKRPYKQKLGNVAKLPSPKTLQMEQTALRQLFRWANLVGIVSRIPVIKAPQLNKNRGISRRPAFDREEWKKLRIFLRNWIKEPSKQGMDGRGPNSHHIWHRNMFYNYVMLMQSTGMRPNEARQLKWQDAKFDYSFHNHKYIYFKIPQNTKTGPRDCVAIKGAHVFLDHIRKISFHTEPNDFIFCDKEGLPIENFGKTFKSVLTAANLLYDENSNKNRTIYSLRHTYATFMLMDRSVNIDGLAKNMGTTPLTLFNHYSHAKVHAMASNLMRFGVPGY